MKSLKDINRFKTILSRYPQYLENTEIKKICSNSTRSGWIWDNSKFYTDKNKIDLHDWAEWTNKRSIFDPRLSEWTALELTKQMCEIIEKNNKIDVNTISDFMKISSDVFPHPGNFVLPKFLLEKPLGWEEWKNKIKNKLQRVTKDTDLITHDARISPYWLDDQVSKNQMVLYGCGLVLLGLLRKSHKWPSRWNLPGYTPDWRSLGRSLFTESLCSSYTIRLLSSLLLPRSWETNDIGNIVFNFKSDNDALLDAPEIKDIGNLIKRIKHIQDKLEEYQIEAMNKQSRELIPVNISDLLQRAWLKDE
jgi:hypothetical protein